MAKTGRRMARRRHAWTGCVASAGSLLALAPASAMAQEAAPSPWRSPQVLSGQTALPAGLSSDVNAAGTAVSAWIEPGAGEAQVSFRARVRLFAGEWGPATTVVGPVPVPQLPTFLGTAADPAGNALLVWYEASGQRIRAAMRSAATGTWGPPEVVASTPPTGNLQAALGPDGTAIVAWANVGVPVGGMPLAPRPSLAAVRSPGDGAWSAPETISGPQDNTQLRGLEVSAAGTAVAWWRLEAQPDGADQTSLRPAGGPWSAPEGVSGSATSFFQDVAIAPDGRLVAVGLRRVNSERVVPVVAERAPGGRWGALSVIAPGGLGERLELSSVSTDRAGNAVALGSRTTLTPASGLRVQTTVAERAAGGTWGALRLVSDQDLTGRGGRLAVSERGAGVALWTRVRGTARQGLGASYRSAPGGRWSAPEDVAPIGTSIDGSAVHADTAGRALALWVQGSRVHAAERAAGSPGRVRLTASQLRTNQRIAQAAVRRANALVARLEAGIRGEDLRPGALLPASFSPGVTTSGAHTGALRAPRARRPLEVAPPGRATGRIRLSEAQLLINQRIGQAAVRRANAIAAMLEGGLTGGNIVDGTIGPDALAPGVSIAASAPEEPAAPARIEVAPPRAGAGGRVTLSARQLLINQRVYQAAVRRLNALVARVEGGLSGADLRPGTISQADLAPGLRD